MDLINKDDNVNFFFGDYVNKFDNIYNHVFQEASLSNFITKIFRKSMRKRMWNSFADLGDQTMRIN